MLLLPWTSRPGGSKCAFRDIARKLHLGPPICALRDISQLVASHESTRPQATLVLCYRRLPRGFIQFLPNLTTLLCFSLGSPFGRRRWGAKLEDSNLVDPASSHMLVSKTKPCMSKFKRFKRWDCGRLIISVIVYLMVDYYKDNRRNSRANTCTSNWFFSCTY